MALLERLVVHVLATDGVWFARTGEVADRFRAMNPVSGAPQPG